MGPSTLRRAQGKRAQDKRDIFFSGQQIQQGFSVGDIFLITIAGDDVPGLTASLAGIMAGHQVNILDMGQAVIHDRLVLGMMVEVGGDDSSELLKDVLFHAHARGLQLQFTPITPESYRQWVAGHGKSRYIVTLLARKITAQQIAEVARVMAVNGLNIDDITRLSGRVALDDAAGGSGNACIEFSVRGEPTDIRAMHAEFLHIANALDVDIAFQKDNAWRRNRRLVVFDMDSTLIQTEVIDELARAAGVGEQVAAITERAMNGELDFIQSFTQRVALLKGLDASVLETIAERLPLTEGAERLVGTLKKLGYKTAILSGGFTYFGERLKTRLGIDHVYANELEIAGGHVTGNVVGRVVDGARKAELVRELAAREGYALEQVIAVGDGANDLPMLNLAGLGIAFRAKPVVRSNAKQAISTLGLDGVLYLIGVRDSDFAELV